MAHGRYQTCETLGILIARAIRRVISTAIRMHKLQIDVEKINYYLRSR